MRIKLSGWQRIGIVLNAIYLIIIVIIALYEWPTQKQIESSWVYSALNAIRNPESPIYAYELRESRFKHISDRELIKIINLKYYANRGKMPNIFEMLSDFRNLDKTEQDKVLASNPKVSEIINAFNGLPKIEQDKVVNHYSSKPQAQSEAQPQSPGGKLIDIFDLLNPQQPATIEQTGTPRPPDFESIHLKIEVARKAGYSDSEIADYLAKKNNFDIQGARKEGYSDNEIINYFSCKNSESSVTDPFLIAQLNGELVKPWENSPNSV